MAVGYRCGVDNADMEMGVLVEEGAELMDEDHRADTGGWSCAWTFLSEGLLDNTQHDVECRAAHGGIPLQKVTQPL